MERPAAATVSAEPLADALDALLHVNESENN